jgi:hypothetical protein
MVRWLLCLFMLCVAFALPSAAQSDSAPSPGSIPSGGAVVNSPSISSTRTSRKVWTNDNLGDASGTVSVVGDKRNQKYSMTHSKLGDPATASRIRENLQKLQTQLDDVNKKLATYKAFEEGELVSTGGRDVNKGYSRVPVDQQMASLQVKKKDLETKIDALFEEARKKGIEPGQLR